MPGTQSDGELTYTWQAGTVVLSIVRGQQDFLHPGMVRSPQRIRRRVTAVTGPGEQGSSVS